MKRFLKRLVPFFLSIGVLASIGWYLLEYDREFTRDMLISNARFYDARGNGKFAALLYDLAYDYTGQDDDVAIELANQYRNDGNFTKAESTLTHAIADRPSVELYIALSKTFVEQDKLLDAVRLLDNVTNPDLRMELDRLRPEAPQPNHPEGYYSKYISVDFSAGDSALYCTTDGDYPSTGNVPMTEAITLPLGETIIQALRVDSNGLVSPLTVLSYTIGGVIEEAVFYDPAMEQAVRTLLNVPEGTALMTDQIWTITEFTVPEGVTDLRDLAFFPYLEKLTLNGHRISSLADLEKLPELKELSLRGCRFPVAEMAVISRLPQLNVLNLSECGLSTIADLECAPKLTHLDLSSNTLRNLDVLAGMENLQEVYLQHNAVTSLFSLSELKNLRTLDISYNSVTDLTPLAHCPDLTWLNAGNNSIESVEGLEAFSSLQHLDLDHNKLSNVSVLSQCTNLTELNISYNAIQEIKALSQLTNLTTLNCSYNLLTNLPEWPEGSALSILDASYNEITSVWGLRLLEELTYVYMDYNTLTNIDSIAGCYRLVMVNVYGNEISDISKFEDHDIIVNYDPT